ncbi:MAG: DUF84 family protein [Bacilli bacterium]|nr:DUF84 family protein [Bacilli bacterium]
MKVFVATKNEGKIEACRKAFESYFDEVEISGVSCNSEVGEQPVNEEISEGCHNRITNLKSYCFNEHIDADYYCAIESGIQNFFGKWMITNIAIIADKNGYESVSSSASFPVPERYAQRIIDTNLNDVLNSIFESDEDRHNHGGGIQLLTKGKVSRIDLSEEAFTMALTTYLNEKTWK